MIFGDPDKFSIWLDAVDLWSTDRFKNGCFAYFIGGKLFWSLKSTIGADINLLSKMHCLKNSVENVRLFNMPMMEAYVELCSSAFPSMDSDAERSDFTHLISVGSLMDEGHNVFLVEAGNDARLIYGFNNDPSSVFEHFLERGEVQVVAKQVVASWKAS
ncbi:immunity 42 family protein [Ralstonia solanacearum]|uniref:Immunity 42 family protein n=1 Tax=Ralstonia solanacearum TaxID=305 RepID=A0AAE3T6B5_RALSL|nr:immunity 42 family protein [Ralstonia solanacearum]MDB0525054.1 immunity 42 family protein [Ralstonia solanacearum]